MSERKLYKIHIYETVLGCRWNTERQGNKVGVPSRGVFSRRIRVHTRVSILIILIRQSVAGGGQRGRRLAARDALTDERVLFRDSPICRHTRSMHALYGTTTLHGT